MADQQRVTEPSEEAQVIAAYLLTHVGGDETDPWQAGHNYAMREASRLTREQAHLLTYGEQRPCCDCGAPPPHTPILSTPGRVECGGWPAEDEPDTRQSCGASWSVDQRGVFTDAVQP